MQQVTLQTHSVSVFLIFTAMLICVHKISWSQVFFFQNTGHDLTVSEPQGAAQGARQAASQAPSPHVPPLAQCGDEGA